MTEDAQLSGVSSLQKAIIADRISSNQHCNGITRSRPISKPDAALKNFSHPY